MLLQPTAMFDFIHTYIPDVTARATALASPLLSRSAAPLHAPALLLLCQCDLLQPEGLQYAHKLRAEGGDVQVAVTAVACLCCYIARCVRW